MDLTALLVSRALARVATIAAGGLVAFGVLLIVAANWSDWGTTVRFGLLGGVTALAALVAAVVPRARIPAGLVVFAATGGLFALLGMTYQTGADPWTLFAWWAVLTLPLALAVRHDAVWTPWVLVAFTALPLWLSETVPRGGIGPSTHAILIAWAIAVAITLAMAAVNRSRTPHEATWAFRLAMLLAVTLVSVLAVLALVGDLRLAVYLLGTLIIAAALVRLTFARPIDVAGLTVAALGLDALLIAGVWRAFIGADVDVGGMLLLTGLGVAIVVATMRLLRRVVEQVARAAGTPVPSLTLSGAALGALGAVLGLVPFTVALTALFGSFFSSPLGAFVIGAGLVAGGVMATSREDNFGFAQMSGLILLLSGTAAMAFGVSNVLPARAVALGIVGLAVGLAAIIPPRWIAGLLGLGAAPVLGVAITWPVEAWVQMGHPALTAPILALAVMGGAAAVVASRADLAARLPLALGPDVAGRALTFCVFWLGGVLLVTMVAAGPTFLFGGATGATGGGISRAAASWIAPSRIVAVLLAATVVVTALVLRRSALGLLDAALGVFAIVLVAVAPPLAVPILIGAVAWVLVNRGLAVAAAIVALWCIGAFYYRLDLELTQKGVLLGALGVGLGAIAFWTAPVEPAASRPVRLALAADVASALVAMTTRATGSAVVLSIRDNEAILRAGRLVHIHLVPVDPRSLVQGDYMALRFALPDVPPSLAETWRLQAVGDVDASGVATLRRIEATPAARGPDEIVVDLAYKRGWIVASDAFFFREGRAKTFDAAKFGTFRIAPDGRARLVGLADATLQPLR